MNWSQAELAQLVAPIALYPDPLLTRILEAGAHPLDVAEAAPWTLAKGPDKPAPKRAWDANVRALLAYPRVLDMMSSNLSWTQRLGSAYVSQPKALDRAVQSLRTAALTQGTLKSGADQTVSVSGDPQAGGRITIKPTRPGAVRVPVYDAAAAYGAWPYPVNPPYVLQPSGPQPGKVSSRPMPPLPPKRQGPVARGDRAWPGSATGEQGAGSGEGSLQGKSGSIGSLGGLDPAYPGSGYRSEGAPREARSDGGVDPMGGLYPARPSEALRPDSNGPGSRASRQGHLGRLEGVDPGATGLFDNQDARSIYSPPPTGVPDNRPDPGARRIWPGGPHDGGIWGSPGGWGWGGRLR